MSGTLFEQYKAALRQGHLAALAGDLQAALDAYETASRLVPERPLPIASQATVLHRLDRWPEAAEAFDLALRLAPDNDAALRARAVARAERGLHAGAAADFERLAFVLDVAGRSAEAAEAARWAVDLEPSASRASLADRLAAAAAHVADLMPSGPVRDAPAADLLAAADPQREEPTEPGAPNQGPEPEEPGEPEPAWVDPASVALAARIAELGTQPGWVDMSDRTIGGADELGPDGQPWPPVDLPSLPPPPIEGPPPDPEALIAEAALLIDRGEVTAARDRMLTAVTVHRAAGRLDAALDVCLDLLTSSPGDPRVHLAIANLQLDRGWTGIATEKLELLVRLTSLSGDTQAEADVHGLASERLRDDVLSSSPGH